MEAIYQALIGLVVTSITTLASYLGVTLKKLFEKRVNTKIKKDVARTVVNAVEQLYKDLHGEEKYNKAVEAMTEMLSEKGIAIGELEIRMLIESAVAEFNRVFESKAIADSEETA